MKIDMETEEQQTEKGDTNIEWREKKCIKTK